MTREEAIKIIDCYDIGFYDLSGEKIPADKLAEAFDMAIEALQTPPISQRSMYQAGYRQAQSDAIEAIEIVDWYHQNSNKDMVHGANDDEHQAWYKADDVYKALEAVPSADRPKGEWLEVDSFESEKHSVTDMRCSLCGKYASIVLPHGNRYVYDFCPNCGADMRSE